MGGRVAGWQGGRVAGKRLQTPDLRLPTPDSSSRLLDFSTPRLRTGTAIAAMSEDHRVRGQRPVLAFRVTWARPSSGHWEGHSMRRSWLIGIGCRYMGARGLDARRRAWPGGGTGRDPDRDRGRRPEHDRGGAKHPPLPRSAAMCREPFPPPGSVRPLLISRRAGSRWARVSAPRSPGSSPSAIASPVA